jgi:hypothetical protein
MVQWQIRIGYLCGVVINWKLQPFCVEYAFACFFIIVLVVLFFRGRRSYYCGVVVD